MRDIPILSSLLARTQRHNDVEKSAATNNPQVPPPAASRPYSQDINGAQSQTFSHTPIGISSSVNDFVSRDDRLGSFRRLVGIDSAPTLADTRLIGRRGPNVGIYTHVVKAEENCRKMFRTFSILINSCLGLQIVVAATLTALGAAGGSRGAVTVFGAINTIIAGFLTYLKGSGLPNRFKYFAAEWRKIREYIEQRERELALDAYGVNVEEETRLIEAMYEGVRADVEANVPDSYTSAAKGGIAGALIAKGAHVPTIANTAMDAKRMTVSTIADFNKTVDKEMEAKSEGMQKHLETLLEKIQHVEHKVNQGAADGKARATEGLQQAYNTAQNTVQDTVSRGQSVVDHGVTTAHGTYHDGVQHGSQTFQGAMERSMALLHERLAALDQGLTRVQVERKEEQGKKDDRPGPST